ncbi:MAG: hypothetical protein QM644_10290 [Mobilitalea sp.]
MGYNWKVKVARATACNRKLDRKLMRLKASWDEVEGILNKVVKKKRKC